jgi:hypothetical protein
VIGEEPLPFRELATPSADETLDVVEDDLIGPPPPPLAIAEQEMREEFSWLNDLLAKHEAKGWGTAYRDFADVKLLLLAAQSLGMDEKNNRVADGVFMSSVGDFPLTIWNFIDILDLQHTSGTWRNKMTSYFRIKQLYTFSQHNSGEIPFQRPDYSNAWDVIRIWMDRKDDMLGVDWVTMRFGNTELRSLLSGMVEEIHNGEHYPVHWYIYQMLMRRASGRSTY